jgi:hypothetical protein
LIKLQDASTYFISGATASGKTHLMKTLMAPYRRVLWYDTTFEIDTTDSTYEHIFDIRTLAARFLEGENTFRIAYHPSTAQTEKEFDCVSRIYWQEDFPRWLVVDEVHEFNNSETLKPILKYARKRMLGIITASQRIYDVKPHIRTNARSAILFYAHEGRDLSAIEETYGSESAELVSQIRPLIYDDVSRVVKQVPQCVVYRRGQPPEVVDL